jgi:hypothetical protein
MDPYLEHPARWQGFHNTLISALQLHLAPRLRPRYLVRIERRTYLEEPGELLFVGQPDLSIHRKGGEPAPPATGEEPVSQPDAVTVEIPMPVEVREAFLEIRAVPGGEVVTVVELLSPSNKVAGEGREVYGRKRRAILATLTSLVEVDLVRAGEPQPYRGDERESDYRILVSRGKNRPRAELYPFSVRDPIPTFRLPLRPEDEEPEVDLRSLVDQVYDGASYDLEIDYEGEPEPPLREGDRVWADELLRGAGLRE